MLILTTYNMNNIPVGYEILGTGVINTGTNSMQEGFNRLIENK